MRRAALIELVAVVGAAAAVTAPTPASAASSWTTIATPKDAGQPWYEFIDAAAVPSPAVSGQASSDVTAVNIYCFWNSDSNVDLEPLNGAPLAVSNGTFSGRIAPPADFACTLRAIPTSYSGISGDQNDGYVGAFSGPNVYFGQHSVGYNSAGRRDTGTQWSYGPRADDIVQSPDDGGVLQQSPVDDFTKVTTLPAAQDILALLPANVAPASSSATHSEIRVDGRNAYLPHTLSTLTTDKSTVPNATISSARDFSTGSLTVRASYPISRCATDAYPQASGSCVTRSTGVVLRRTVHSLVGGGVLDVTDRFVSVDGKAHRLWLEYSASLNGPQGARPGVRLPGQSGFHVPKGNTTDTGLPVGAHTIVLTSDIHASDGAPNRADEGVTYAGRPTLYFATSKTFGMRYGRHTAPRRPAVVTFGLEGATHLSTLTAWAGAEQRIFRPHLRITAPHEHATVSASKTTIKGFVTNATSGFPSTVTVRVGNHVKHATVTPTGHFSAGFVLHAGKHTAKVVATDPGGDRMTGSVAFRRT